MRFLAVLLLLTGCGAFAPPPASQPSLPQTYRVETGGQVVAEAWWTQFGSQELNQLMDLGLSASPDIRTAWARLRQTRALAAKTGAAQWPSLTGNGDATRTWTKKADTDTVGTDTFGLGLAASYELDLWGRVHALRQADLLEANATEDDLRAAAMTVQGEIAEAWFSLCATRRQLAVLEDQQRTNVDLLSALELRFANSLATALDVLEQREAMAQTEALIPPLKAQGTQLENTIALLLGRAPGGVEITAAEPPAPMPMPDLGLPASLLADRPDIRAARLRLEAAGWDLAAARADQMPALRLNGKFEQHGDDISRVFDNWIASLATALTAPILDGGARRAEVRRQEAIGEELLAKYEKTVLAAMSEVDTLVDAILRQEELLQAQAIQLDAAKAARASALLRYRNGVLEYATVISLHLKVQQLQRTMIQQQGSLLTRQAGLCRALGKGWRSALSPTPIPTEATP